MGDEPELRPMQTLYINANSDRTVTVISSDITEKTPALKHEGRRKMIKWGGDSSYDDFWSCIWNLIILK